MAAIMANWSYVVVSIIVTPYSMLSCTATYIMISRKGVVLCFVRYGVYHCVHLSVSLSVCLHCSLPTVNPVYTITLEAWDVPLHLTAVNGDDSTPPPPLLSSLLRTVGIRGNIPT